MNQLKFRLQYESCPHQMERMQTSERAQRNDQHLVNMLDDGMETVGFFLSSVKDVCALMRTCKAFSGRQVLRSRLPSLRIRPVLGAFPHHLAHSIDRQVAATGRKTRVQRCFVISRQAVRLYVDFGLVQRRSTPLKKKQRSDGLCNRDHDFSDDEFEDPPDARVKRAPTRRRNPYPPLPQGAHPEMLDLRAKFERGETRRRAQWEDLEGPSEKLERHTFFLRQRYTDYFTSSLNCSVALVYADTHEDVPCERFKGAIQPSNQLARDNLTFCQQTHKEFKELPAVAKFHIPHLSADHDGRLFKLRITGNGKVVNTKNTKALVVFSQPFEVVSKLDVIKQAEKRRTPVESSSHLSLCASKRLPKTKVSKLR